MTSTAAGVEAPDEALSRLDVDDHRARWRSLDALLRRNGRFVGPGFVPGDDAVSILRDYIRVLVVGAGGLGCELLKGLGACAMRLRCDTTGENCARARASERAGWLK